MLENELWGNTIENWGISILIILGAIIIVIPSAVVNTYLVTILTKIHSGYMNTTN